MIFKIDSFTKQIEIEQLTFEEVFKLQGLLKELDAEGWDKYKIISKQIFYTTHPYTSTTTVPYHYTTTSASGSVSTI